MIKVTSKQYPYLNVNGDSVDAINRIWASVEEFETFLSDYGLPVKEGTKIRIKSGNEYLYKVRIGSNWSTFTDITTSEKQDIDNIPTIEAEIEDIKDNIDNNSGAIDELRSKTSNSLERLSNIENKTEALENGSYKFVRAKSSTGNVSAINEILTQKAQEASDAAYKSTILAGKAAASLEAIEKTLEDIKNGDDEITDIAVAKNTGDIEKLKNTIGDDYKEFNITGNNHYTIVDFPIKAGIKYRVNWGKLKGFYLSGHNHQSNENSQYKTEDLVGYEDVQNNPLYGKGVITDFVPSRDAKYLMFYVYNDVNDKVSVTTVGVIQDIKDLNNKSKEIDQNKNDIDNIKDVLGVELLSCHLTGSTNDNYLIVPCEIKAGKTYSVRINNPGTFIISSKDHNDIDSNNIEDNLVYLAGSVFTTFVPKYDASYLQFYSLKYSQDITISSVGLTEQVKSGNGIFKNKKCLWLGTSIPAGGDTLDLKYPAIVAEKLAMTITNKSVGSSYICKTSSRVSVDTPSGSARYCLTMTQKEMSDLWLANISDVELYCSFESLMSTLDENTDIVVIDHGFNDRQQCKLMVDKIDKDIKIDYTSRDRSTFNGAIRYLLDEIYKRNPRCKVVIAGYFTNNHNCYDAEGTMNTSYVCRAQEYVAKAYNLQILRIWNLINASDDVCPVTSEYLTKWNQMYSFSKTSLTHFNLFCPDGVHPHTDKTKKSISLYADAICQCLTSGN